MKSVKSGRGPSALGAAGSIAAVIFGIFWTIIAFSMTKGMGTMGLIFPLFGIIFIILGIANTVFHFKNATGKNRMSLVDITDSTEDLSSNAEIENFIPKLQTVENVLVQGALIIAGTELT